jgi:rSAM/selenodomain-associated transferase 1
LTGLGRTRAGVADVQARCGIAVMAKASLPGQAKTRLVPPLRHQEAADFNTAFLKDVFANIRAAARLASIAGYAAGGPPGSESFFNSILSAETPYFDCWFGNFGRCLRAAAWKLFDCGHESAIVLNSDSPTLPTELLAHAADVLAIPGDRVVLGPADDGGYYLLGLKCRHDRLFEDIEWSTERVSEQTLVRAGEIGVEVCILAEWYDVDNAAALRRLHSELFAPAAGAGDSLRPSNASHTAQLMRRLLDHAQLVDRLFAGS